MNKCFILGNLTRNPELRTTTSEKSVTSFTLAVSRRFAGPNGEREADFLPVVVWGKQAENCAKYLRKGSQCAVAGSIQVRNYEANDGSRRYVTEIIADEVQFLSRSGSVNNERSEVQRARESYTGGEGQQMEPEGSQAGPDDMQEINEDLPF